jgi:DNA-directed RNA polymerase subunit N (RpoN/RPB10)
MRRVMILRCSRCGNVVTDSYAQYSPEKNRFWCKNCISEAGAETFHTA